MMPPDQSYAIGGRASGSQHTLAGMQLALEAWTDVLNSPLSTAVERIATLNSIEKALVQYTRPSTSQLVGLDPTVTFWELQGVAGFNIAENLLALLYRLHVDIARQEQSVEEQFSQAQSLAFQQAATQICLGLTILQGLTLCNATTKRIMQRKASLELLLQIVLADYCTQLLPSLLSPPSTPVATSEQPPMSLPSGFALDLLMCVLVDSTICQERFADMGGIQQIQQLSHKCADAVVSASTNAAVTISALKQTDLLCLEFRYFWTQLLKGSPMTPSQQQTPMQGKESEDYFSTKHGTPRAKSRITITPPPSSPPVETTPKANRRRITAPLDTNPTFESIQGTASDVASAAPPRRLRQSTSTVELRRRITASSLDTSQPMPNAQSSDNVPGRASSATPSSSSTLQSARRSLQARQSIASFRTVEYATHPTSSTASDSSGAEILPRNPPGMSSRDRPRIPSPLKPRASLQHLSASSSSHHLPPTSSRASLDLPQQTSMAIGLRRSRASIASASLTSISATSSPTSSPFTSDFSADARRSRRMEYDSEDIENRDPSSRASPIEYTVRRKPSSPPSLLVLSESPKQTLAPSYSAQNIKASSEPKDSIPLLKTQRSMGILRSTTTSSFTPVKKARPPGATSLGLGLDIGPLTADNGMKGKSAKIPPSPAVRRAQMARAKSLSPTKFALACGREDSLDSHVPRVPNIPTYHLTTSDM